jgi:hypothetical protein
MDEFIYGCCGGVFGTILSHPVDTIRINLQSKKIPKYKGCCLALTRAFILHCGVFSGYEFTKQIFGER